MAKKRWPHYWSVARENHRSLVEFLHNGPAECGVFVLWLMLTRTNSWKKIVKFPVIWDILRLMWQVHHKTRIIPGKLRQFNGCWCHGFCLLNRLFTGPNQRKHHSSASLAFVMGIHRWHRPFDGVIIWWQHRADPYIFGSELWYNRAHRGHNTREC